MARDSFVFGQLQERMTNRIARLIHVDAALTVAAQRSDSEFRDAFRRTKDTVGGFGWSCCRDDRRIFLPTHPNDADGSTTGIERYTPNTPPSSPPISTAAIAARGCNSSVPPITRGDTK